MTLQREVGLFGATMMGLGSIVGTGVFVSIGLAAHLAGANVLLAVALAAAVATCNALASALLAANHPVSGGTYEYGYRYLNSWLGFAAGWMFLCAKSASAATAALGFAGYLLQSSGGQMDWLPYFAVATVAILTAVVLAGIRISSRLNVIIVCVTLASLLLFVLVGTRNIDVALLKFDLRHPSLPRATALMFVAYTGYGRIATLGEEVIEPRRTIPRAIITTLLVSMSVYLAVAFVYVGTISLRDVATPVNSLQYAAPLETAARRFSPSIHSYVAIGAMTAMLGVLLNLLLGLSRVLLAMGRRGDMPVRFAQVNQATVAIGLTIGALAALGSVKTTWSFSAFTVLIYYAITNLASLRLHPGDRLFSPIWSWIGLVACLLLAFSIEPSVWLTGSGLLGLGLVWHAVRRRRPLMLSGV